ncbi:hypothetical protein THRCLA_01038 [Thraustotheca clavata]|uniref:Uncharacterized protein n=1 Tax=Thraustotheca clavata TaxID=74557 RepID=A0A1W0A9F4_9STRA|nr:hypothetical protein THRCLA_01038 [Thraustotheca clavata]
MPSNANLVQVAIEQSYSESITLAKAHPVYPVALITAKLTSLEHASLRNTIADALAWLPIQYCWIDFNRTWELTHTILRQVRCGKKYNDNSAVYLDPVLRNTLWNNLPTTTSSWHCTLRKHNVTTRDFIFQLQWQDGIFPGLEQNINIVNAIGIIFPVFIKCTPEKYDSSVAWSTLLSPSPGIDMNQVDYCNATLIRISSNYFLGQQCDGFNTSSYEGFSALYNEDRYLHNEPGLLHEALCPFSSNLWVVPVHEILSDLVISSDLCALTNMSPTMSASYMLLQSIAFTPIPPSWNNEVMYYGGTPTCLFNSPQMFVQNSISYSDKCEEELPLIVTVMPFSMMFSMFLTYNFTTIESICNLQNSSLRRFDQIASKHISVFELAIKAINKLNISIIQFASDPTQMDYTLSTQSLIDGNSPWAFYGWAMLSDWVLGTREVISIEGDNGTFVLISEAYCTSSMTLNQGLLTESQVPTTFSTQLAPKTSLIPKAKRFGMTTVAIGAAYIGISISSSISYFQLLHVNLPNGLIWKIFNTTGVHVFISNLLFKVSAFCNSTFILSLDYTTANTPGQYNLTNLHITFNGRTGARMQYTDLTELATAIVALRNMDPY